MTPPAYVRLDLEAARHNLAQVRRYAPQRRIMAVIKANAYGHGITRMAAALQDADAFAVARVDEGVRLRQAGFCQPITVLQGFACNEELQLLLQFQLESVIHMPHQIELLKQQSHSSSLSVWLKVDTGMNRLGFRPEHFADAYQQLARCPAVQKPIKLMTHFASADDLQSSQTQRQIELFARVTQDLPGPRSIANSAGIIGWPQLESEWVRPGLMLYGCSPFADKSADDLGLKPVMSLHSRLIAVKSVAVGESVGYSASWTAEQPTRLGVISIGYGDGYHRSTQSGAPVLVNNARVPLIGRVSMDMITVNLNDQPQAQPGDPVVLWGNGLPVEQIAPFAQTIPYTLLCGITQRVQMLEQ